MKNIIYFIYSNVYLFKSMFLAISAPSIKYFYIKVSHFQHLCYVKNLAKDCKHRLEKMIKDEKRRDYMSDKNVMIKVIGKLTDENRNFLSKVKGKGGYIFKELLY